MANILFVGSGNRVSLIESFLEKKTEEDNIICTDSDRSAPTKHLPVKFYPTTPWSKPEIFLEEIREICRSNKVNAIIPLVDGATNTMVIANLPLILGTSHSMNKICKNKLTTDSFFRSVGVQVPNIYSSPNHNTIAKPITGSGAKGQFFVGDSAIDIHYAEHHFSRDDYLYSEFIEGQEYTVDCFKDLKGNVLCIVPRLREVVKSGEVQVGRTVKQNALINIIKHQILPFLSFSGCICIQAIEYEKDKFKFIEINDRFGSGAPLSIRAGADMPGWIFKMLKNEDIESTMDFKEIKMYRAHREFYEVLGG